MFQMKNPVDLNELDLTNAVDLLDFGKFYGQYHCAKLVNFYELPVCEHFYADSSVQKRLKRAQFDLLLADTLYSFTR